MNKLQPKSYWLVLGVALVALEVFVGFCGESQGEDLEEEPPESSLKLSLQQCIQFSLQNRNSEWRYGEDVLRGQMLQVSTNYIPRIQVEESVGPLPNDDYSALGVLNRVKVGVGVPVYDFGRTSLFYGAAKSHLQAEMKGNELKANQDVLETVQLYYGILLAKESLDVLYDARSKLVVYRDETESRYKKRKADVSRADFLQIDLELLKLEQRIDDTEAQLANGYDALRTKIGFDRSKGFDVEERSLRPVSLSLGKLEEYQDLALRKRPEVEMFVNGLQARNSLVSAEERAYLPAFLVGGFLEQGVGTSRPDNDDFNFFYGGLGVRLNWNFDWTSTQGKIKVARSEYQKLLEQQRLALPAIELDVTRAFRETQRTREQVERGKKASKLGRALLFFAKSNWDLGIGDPVKLKDALVRFNEARFHHLKSVFDFNVAVAKLSQTVGEDLLVSRN